MNFRTVGIIRNGLKRGESGQAFAELAVSLIAILATFVGFLLVAVLSSDHVSMIIHAREEADNNARSGLFSNDARSIRYWNYGGDEIPFTQDDRAVLGSAGDGALFIRQLTDNSGKTQLTNPPSSSSLHSDFASLQDSNLFVNAASLATGEEHKSNSLRAHNLDSLEYAAQWLFGIRGTYIEEQAYMPAHKDLSDERGE